MKTLITENNFRDAFRTYGRDCFTYHGLGALFNYLEEYEESTGEEIMLDVVALCCEYTEYDSLEELQQSHPDIEDEDDLQDHTSVVCYESNCIIIQEF